MDALLPQGTIEPLMSLDDNIEFLSAQRTIFKRLVGRSDVVIKELDLDLLSTGDEVRPKIRPPARTEIGSNRAGARRVSLGDRGTPPARCENTAFVGC
ncbi:hypothetical protein QP162_20865 [Sphingomonas aurantiaca]|uniref:hypothetical protein n=1 Tax=Sphingomonas aurantiaca TaxID=185949 RepID=UPI002FE1608E